MDFFSVLPRGSPRISGGQTTYHLGDLVRVNCTSERSKPAATLHWFINNDPVREKEEKERERERVDKPSAAARREGLDCLDLLLTLLLSPFRRAVSRNGP